MLLRDLCTGDVFRIPGQSLLWRVAGRSLFGELLAVNTHGGEWRFLEAEERKVEVVEQTAFQLGG
jgi:hypothetical protein